MTQITKLSPSTISNKQIGQSSSSAGLKEELDHKFIQISISHVLQIQIENVMLTSSSSTSICTSMGPLMTKSLVLFSSTLFCPLVSAALMCQLLCSEHLSSFSLFTQLLVPPMTLFVFIFNAFIGILLSYEHNKCSYHCIVN